MFPVTVARPVRFGSRTTPLSSSPLSARIVLAVTLGVPLPLKTSTAVEFRPLAVIVLPSIEALLETTTMLPIVVEVIAKPLARAVAWMNRAMPLPPSIVVAPESPVTKSSASRWLPWAMLTLSA